MLTLDSRMFMFEGILMGCCVFEHLRDYVLPGGWVDVIAGTALLVLVLEYCNH